MSWIFGYTGTLQDDLSSCLSTLHTKALFVFKNRRHYISAGGFVPTIFSYSNSPGDSGRLITGIVKNPLTKQKLSANELQLLKSLDTLPDYDGHFIGLEWDADTVKIISDDLGLRQLYIVPYKDGHLFSTNIDWLAQLVPYMLDYSQFGSLWLLYNQISQESVFSNYVRVACGRKAVLASGRMQLFDNFWLPTAEGNHSGEYFLESLDKQVAGELSEGKKISLSLSGGIDSRVLLSSLLQFDRDRWDVHTFGSEDVLDRQIADRICADNGITQRHYTYHDEQIDFSDFIRFMKFSRLNHPATAYLQFRNYQNLAGEHIIDGAFGELFRRVYSNRLFYTQSKAILQKNPEGIFKGLQFSRADIFLPEVNRQMFTGAIQQLETICTLLPEASAIGIGNWLDLFTLKTRMSHFLGNEQCRLDEFLECIMPFSQKSLIRDLLNYPVKLKQNSGLLKQSIYKRAAGLSKYPLAKGAIAHPFGLTATQTQIWLKLTHLAKKKRTRQKHYKFYQELGVFTADIAGSQKVRECGFIDTGKMQNILKTIKTPDTFNNPELDWLSAFLTFYFA